MKLALSPRYFLRSLGCGTLVLSGLLAGCLLPTRSDAPSTGVPTAGVDWSAFLAREDLVWKKNPTAWEDAAFIGNGNLGASIYVQNGALAWEVNRADVTHAGSRLPMGHVALRTAGQLTGGDVRLDLWNAEARGIVQTDRGTVRWRSFTATSPAVIVIELEGTAGETEADLAWHPPSPPPPASGNRKAAAKPEEALPAPTESSTAAGTTIVQPFNGGGAYALALTPGPAAGAKKIFFLSIGSAPTGDAALAEAVADTGRAVALGLEPTAAAHRAWWHAYYPASFLSIPDARLEAFYWIQIYKLGSAMRADGPILDLMGPWFRTSPWLRIWFNLNVQLTYSPLFAANRLAPAESLFGALDRGTPALIRNVPPALRADAAVIGRSASYDLVRAIDLSDPKRSEAGSEAGNLPWTMYYYWEYYRYQMDDAILRDRVLPLLRRAINHYLAYLEKGADGHWHLPPTLSPELAIAPDCTYDLALLRWGCQTLIDSCEHLKIADPLLPRWRDVLANLTPYPIDATGLMIGRGRALQESHRHYSHLLAVYPLHLIVPDVPADRALIAQSLAHWTSKPEKFRGFSYTGAAAMHALLGQGDQADDFLQQLLNKVIKPNTMYTEAGPVIETPLSGATSLQEMLLQSWGGKLRVFPAVPAAWPEASFATLRAEGAFLVSAVHHEGKTAWVRVESLAGEPCRIVVPDWTNAVVRDHSGAAPRVTTAGNGEFVIELAKGAAATLAPSADAPLPSLAPVATPADAQNPYPEHFR